MKLKESVSAAYAHVREALLDLLCPENVICLCCGSALGGEDGESLCTACAQALAEMEEEQRAREAAAPPEGIRAVHSAYPYTAQARRLILRLKYAHVRDAAVPLARAMAMLPLGEADLLVPVPTTKRRERERGYNQAQVLCSLIAQETGMPMALALRRTAERASQTRLSRLLRKRNLVGTMRADARADGMRVLLVDDVYTTGATAQEAARALLEAGAADVSVVTAAQSPKAGGKLSPVSRKQNVKGHAGF